MCFSTEASLAALLLGLASSASVYSLPKPEDKVLGLFFAFVSLMQGIEYLLWSHPICDSWNRNISRLGMWLNHHQPIVLGTLILKYFPRTQYKSTFLFLMTLYFSLLVPYGLEFHRLPNEQQCTHTTCEDHIPYSWANLRGSNILYSVYLFLFIAFPLLGFQNKAIAISSVVAGSIAWLTTGFFYKQKYFSSLWCFYAVFLPSLYSIARRYSIL